MIRMLLSKLLKKHGRYVVKRFIAVEQFHIDIDDFKREDVSLSVVVAIWRVSTPEHYSWLLASEQNDCKSLTASRRI